MATLTNADANLAQPGAMLRSGAVSGGLDDLAAQFDQRRFRPLGVTDLFDEAFELYRSNFLLFLGTAAIILVPLNALIYEFVLPRLTAVTQQLSHNQIDTSQIYNFFGEALTAASTYYVIHGLFFIVLSGASIAIASNRYLNRPAQLGPAYKTALRRALPLLLCVVLATLATAVATPFCVIPGLYVACRFTLLPQVVMLEPSLKPFAALKRAWQLSSQHFWRISGVLSLLALVTWVILLSLQGPLQLALSALPLDSLPFLSDVARHEDISLDVTGVISGLLTTPFTFIALTALYYDIRIRDEGYDMAILASHLGFGDLRQLSAAALPQAAPPPRLINRAATPIAKTLPEPKRKPWQRKQNPPGASR